MNSDSVNGVSGEVQLFHQFPCAVFDRFAHGPGCRCVVILTFLSILAITEPSSICDGAGGSC